jgi:uncharacterized protein (DUF433 family)
MKKIVIKVHTLPGAMTFARMGLPRITTHPSMMTGVPCVRSLRIPVATIVKLLAAGWTPHRVLQEYPLLELEDIRQALSFAAWQTDEQYVPLALAK